MNPSQLLASVAENMDRSSMRYALFDPVTLQPLFLSATLKKWLQAHSLSLGMQTLESLPEVHRTLQQCAKQRQERELIVSALKVQLRISPFMQGNELLALQCFAVEMPAPPKADRQRNLHEKLLQFIDRTALHVWLYKPNGEIYWFNEALQRYLFGEHPTEEELKEKRWITSVHPNDITRTNSWFMDFMLQSGDSGVDYRLKRHDGSYRWFYSTAIKVMRDDDQLAYVMGLSIDIDDFKNKEAAQALALEQMRLENQLNLDKMLHVQQELITVQKRELVDHLASGVSHDLNNLLFIMNLNSNMLKKRIHDEQALSHLDSIHKTIKKAGRLASQLVTFSRRKPQSAVVVNLREVIDDIDDLLRNTVGPGVQLTLSVAEGTACVKVDRNYFENALINLAINARDAVSAKGQVDISIYNQPPEPGSAPQVVVHVKDNGTGMSDAVRAQIFQPFYTTKADGKGTGLGLPMVQGFVRQSNGHIEVQSELGKGTSFFIHLPCSDEATAPGLPVPADSLRGDESLLIVEDDTDVRDALALALLGLGYRVTTAFSCDLALQYLRSGMKVDLILSDVRMSGEIQPPDLLQRLKADKRKTPVLFVTGHGPAEVESLGLRDEAEHVLFKPFSIDELSHRIRAILQSQCKSRDPQLTV